MTDDNSSTQRINWKRDEKEKYNDTSMVKIPKMHIVRRIGTKTQPIKMYIVDYDEHGEGTEG